MMKAFNRIILFLMVAIMFVALTPFSCVSAVEEQPEVYTLTIENSCESSFIAENSAEGRISFFGNTVYSGSYGNQLSGVAKELYDFLVKQYATDKKTGEYTYTFEIPFTFAAEVSGGYIIENEELSEIKSTLSYAIQVAKDAFLYDHPEVFWLRLISSSYSFFVTGNSVSGYTGFVEDITIRPIEIYSGASTKIVQYDAAVNNALNAITVTESRRDTLKNIHDYICNNAYYNLISDYYVHSSEHFFIGDGGVVCEGYAKSFKVICNRLGIPCALVSGDAGGGHMWNYVQMDDGKWYLVDVTWDDQESRIYDTYFLANANTIGFNGVSISEERTERADFSSTGYFSFTYPALSTTAYVVHIHEWERDYTLDKEATCTESGSKSIHCALCDETKNVTEIPAILHSWDPGVITVASTCNTYGTKTYTCLNNPTHKYIEEIPLDTDNHEGETYISNETLPSCTAYGYSGDIYCSGCNSMISEGEEVLPIGHYMAKWVTNNDGTHSRICNIYGCNYTENVGCIYGDWIITKNATCIKTGLKNRTCTICEYNEVQVIEKTPHDLGEWQYPIMNDCENPSSKLRECENCSFVKSERIEAKEHVRKIIPAVEPTCTSNGRTEGVSCEVCRKIIEAQVTIDKLPHTFGDDIVVEEASCFKEGSGKRICVNCDYCVNFVIPRTEHIKVTVPEVPPTCEAIGIAEGVKCSVCDHKFSGFATIQKLSHEMVETEYVKSTCIDYGYKKEECKNCGLVLREDYGRLEHVIKIQPPIESTCEKAIIKKQ